MKSDGSAWNLRRWLRSAGYAVAGLRTAYVTQANFRIEVWLGVVAVLLALALDVSLMPIFLCCALVLSLELLNTALEAAIDLLSPEHHRLAKVAKDAAAGAVLVACLGSVLVGLWLFIPALLQKWPG